MPRIKRILIAFLAALPALQASVITQPIAMSGSGSWSWKYGLGVDETFSATGSSGGRTVSMSIETGNEYPIFQPFRDLLQIMDPCFGLGTITIDGVSGAQRCGSVGNQQFFDGFSLGQGGGQAAIYDATGKTVLASASLVAYVEINSYQETYFTFNDGATRLVEADARFNINPVHMPEPGSLWLVGAGIVALVQRRRRSKRAA